MVSEVERMTGLHEQLGSAKTPNERTMLERQVEAVDGQIDGLVYELYGLSEEEVRVVEGKPKNRCQPVPGNRARIGLCPAYKPTCSNLASGG
jgi:hypothetical protein